MKKNSIISYILIFTILISSVVLQPLQAEATVAEMLLTPAGYTLAYSMLPYALTGVAVAGSIYLTYKVFSNQKVKSLINSWYNSLSTVAKNIFDTRVASGNKAIDKQFLADVNGLSLVNDIVTASIDELNSSEMMLLKNAYIGSIAEGKTIGQLLEGKDWSISDYNYKTLLLTGVGSTKLTWFFTTQPIEPIGYNWSNSRIEINAVGQTLTTYKDSTVYFPLSFLPSVVYMNLANDMTNNSICLDVDFPEEIKANPVVMQNVLDVPVSLELDYPIDWENEQAIPLVPPVALDEPLTDTIPWGDAYPEAGSNTGDWGLIGDIKNIISSISNFLLNIFTIPEDINIDTTPFQGVIITDKFPFSIPWDIKAFFTYIGTFKVNEELYKWEFPFKIGNIYDDGLTIDLHSISNFNSILSAIRTFNNILFVIMLIIITKRVLF